MKYVRKRSDEGVSPVIATILMVAITVVLAAVLYVLVSGFLTTTSTTKNIGVACVKISGTSNYRCEITSADAGVDFTQVAAQVLDSTGEIRGTWAAPISVAGTTNVTVTAASGNLASTTRVVGNGDTAFGVGDTFFLNANAGTSITSYVLKLSGGGASGQSSLN